MSEVLSNIEARIIGCMIEKSITTPDVYPLTLNALVSACNQKSGRDPMMSLQQGEVLHTIRALEYKTLVQMEENFKSRTEKFSQRFCNSRYSDNQFDPAQLAVVCLLLLRGPQTPGELKARSGRLHSFDDNSAVIVTCNSLIERDGDPLLVKLPRTPGRKDSEYMHTFCGPVDVEAYSAAAGTSSDSKASKRSNVSDLEERVSRLEAELAELKAKIEG
jgi:uncharacterized protein YceH (UPF0502 family)